MKANFLLRNSGILTFSTIIALVAPALAVDGTWQTSASSGNWSDGTKWVSGNIANGAGAIATFNRTPYAGAKTINLDSSRDLGQLLATNSNAGTARNVIIGVSGGSVLTLDNGASEAIISNSGLGALAINPTISLKSSLNISNTGGDSNSYLAISGGISAGTAGLKTVTVSTSTQRVNLSSTISDGAGQIAVVVDAGAGGDVRITTGQAYSGGLTVKSGEYRLFSGSNSTSLGSGTVTLNGGGIEVYTGSTDTFANAMTMGASGGTFETLGTSSVTLSGVIDGAGAFNKQGVGTLLITNTNSYAGGTTVTDGILQTGAVGTLGTGDVSVLAGKTLTLGNNLSLDSSATFTFDLTSIINLNYAGEMTIADLGTGLLFIDNGTYTASQLNSFFGGSTFAGTGSVTVVPEPQSLQLIMVAAFLAFAVMGRRFRTSLS